MFGERREARGAGSAAARGARASRRLGARRPGGAFGGGACAARQRPRGIRRLPFQPTTLPAWLLACVASVELHLRFSFVLFIFFLFFLACFCLFSERCI